MTTDAPVARHARLRLVLQWLGTATVLWVVFGILLPRFIDYADVIAALRSLTIVEIGLLLILAAVRSLSQSAVFTYVIPGLSFWPGWQAFEASGTLASFSPPGVDMAVRYAMYRSFGINAERAGGGFVLSAIFTIGIKFVLPVIALALVLIQGDYTNLTVTLALLAFAVVVIAVSVFAFRREAIARGIGGMVGGWYNRLLSGRLKFERIEDPGQRIVDFRASISGTLGSVWPRATAAQLTAELSSFLILVLALRFVGVDGRQADLYVIFVAYAIGLIASLTPFLPQGLGAVELVYVVVIAGTTGTELGDLVMAAAFTHRIFTWFLPILVGIIPLTAWRRKAERAKRDLRAAPPA